MTKQIKSGLKAVHPGEIWREDVLPALGRPKAEIARLLGVSRATLYAVLGEERPVTVDLALRFAKLTGTSAGLWTRMQAACDLQAAEAALAGALADIPTLPAKAA